MGINATRKWKAEGSITDSGKRWFGFIVSQVPKAGSGSLLQNCLGAIDCVRARLQSCRKWPIQISALAAAGLQITENKTAGAKAQYDLAAPSARLKSCPDTFAVSMEFCKRLLVHPIILGWSDLGHPPSFPFMNGGLAPDYPKERTVEPLKKELLNRFFSQFRLCIMERCDLQPLESS